MELDALTYALAIYGDDAKGLMNDPLSILGYHLSKNIEGYQLQNSI